MTIARYRLPLIGKPKPDTFGEFVTYADHAAAIADLREQAEASPTPAARERRRLRNRKAAKRRAAGAGATTLTGVTLWD